MKKLLVLIILFIPIISYSYDIDEFYYTEDVEDSVKLNNTNIDINNADNLNLDENIVEIYNKNSNSIEVLDYNTNSSETINDVWNLENNKNLQDNNSQNVLIVNDDIINNNVSDNVVEKDKANKEIVDNNDKKLDNINQKDIIVYKTIGETNNDRFVNTANIRFLDKITAKSIKKSIKIGEKTLFNRLVILPLKCWKSYPEEMPENKLLVKVFEIDKNKKEKMIFYGWIFSSTPSISGIEHPMYDITLEDCNNLEYDNQLQGNSKTNKE